MPRILAVKENNMSSPFSKSFLSKNPISLTQKQEDNLPPNLVKEIVKDEEKKETPLTMVDYTDYGTESGYVSTRASLQNMFDGITKGTLAAIEGLKDPQTQADRLGRRLDKRAKRKARREKRGKEETMVTNPAYNKADADQAKKEGKDYKIKEKISKFDLETQKIGGRQKGFQDKADADMQRKLDQYQAMQSLRKNNPEDVKKYNDWLNTPEGKNSTDVEKQLKFKSLNLT